MSEHYMGILPDLPTSLPGRVRELERRVEGLSNPSKTDRANELEYKLSHLKVQIGVIARELYHVQNSKELYIVIKALERLAEGMTG